MREEGGYEKILDFHVRNYQRIHKNTSFHMVLIMIKD